MARYAGKILQFLRSLSWKTLVLEVWILTFCESLVENAHFERLHSQFLRQSRKRSFWKASFSVESLVENARFESLPSQFLGRSRAKRSFWKASFSVFAKFSWKTLVLEGFIPRFCESLVEDARFGRLDFLLGSLCYRGDWKVLETELARIYVRHGGCANAGVMFFGARCARGRCKVLETELVRIYVRSLCHRAIVPPLRDFFSGLAVLGAVASCWKLSSHEFTFARCAVGRLRQRFCVIFFGSLC